MIVGSTDLGRRCTLYAQAITEYVLAGKWDEAMEAYRSIVTESHGHPRFYHRAWGLTGYTTILFNQRAFTGTEADSAFLSSIAKGEHGDGSYIRFRARCALAWLAWEWKQRDKASHHNRLALKIFNKTTELEFSELIYVGGSTQAPARRLMELLRARILWALKKAEHNPFALRDTAEVAAQTRMLDDIWKDDLSGLDQNSVLRDDGCTPDRAFNVMGPRSLHALVAADMLVSNACIHCGVTRETLASLAGRKLMSCARCRKRLFCSKECLQADWRQAHKKECRSPDGPFEAGDKAITSGLQARSELNDCIVEILACAGTDAQGVTRWKARVLVAPFPTISIKALNLHYLLPLRTSPVMQAPL